MAVNELLPVGWKVNMHVSGCLSFQFFAKEKLDVPKEYIDGTIHSKPGAAIALLGRLYTLLTHRE